MNGKECIKIGNPPIWPTPTRPGYKFNGWYTQLSEGTLVKGEDTVIRVEDHTLHAYWEVKTYTVTLDANGGSVSPSEIPVTYGSEYVSADGTFPTPTRQEYTFIGWYTQASGGTRVQEHNTVNIAGNHTLYAMWLPEPDASFIEENINYSYTNESGDYKVFSKTPETGGITANGKNSIIINVTFSLDKIITDNIQYIIGAQNNSGYELYVKGDDIVFGIWDVSQNEYRNIVKNDVASVNSIINVTAVYDGDYMRLYIKKEGQNLYYTDNKIELTLNQKDTVPTLLGENPGESRNYETQSHYKPQDDFHKNTASHFTGKIYNARIWFDETFNDVQIDYIYNKGIKDANNLKNGI